MIVEHNTSHSDRLIAGAWENTRRRDEDVHISDLLHPYRGFERIRNGSLWTPKKPIQARVLIGEGGHRVLRSNGVLEANCYTDYNYDIEVSLDGVVGHIDLTENHVYADGQPGDVGMYGPTIPGELKVTWYSPDKPITMAGTYFDQLGAYCHMMGVTYGRLYVCYLMDYKWRKDSDGDSISPIFDSWDVYFDAEDLVWFWDVLMERKHTILNRDIVINPFFENRDLDGWLINNTEVRNII